MKSSQLQIRVTQEQKEAIRTQASRVGLEMSEWILQKVLPKAQSEFARLQDELLRLQDSKERSFVLAELNDFLCSLGRKDISEIISTPIDSKLSPFVQNYVVAMMETACEEKNIRTPDWFDKVEALTEPYFGTQMLSLRLYLLTASPPAFRKRNIFIDSSLGDRV